MTRTAKVSRKTSETDIEIELNNEKDNFITLISHELNHRFKDYKLRLCDS